MTTEQKLLTDAVCEINRLRSENRLMGARLDMFDSMMLLFQTSPSYKGVGMSEDVVWKIQQHLNTTNPSFNKHED